MTRNSMSHRHLRDRTGREVVRVETPSGVVGYIAAEIPDGALKTLVVKLRRSLARPRRPLPDEQRGP